MDRFNTAEVEAVFGKSSKGLTPEERARSSDRYFIRSQHQLSSYTEGATGRRISAREALDLFGWNTLKELANHSAVPILHGVDEPYRTIECRLKSLGLSLEKAGRLVGWTPTLTRSFQQRAQLPFRQLEKLAQSLSLEPDVLGVLDGARGDNELGVRLREIKGGDTVKFSDTTVLGLSEAAWVIRKQEELATAIGSIDKPSSFGFKPSNDYGDASKPAWSIGYELASRTRELLDIPASDPLRGLTELIETRLGIAVIQMDLPPSFAGATVANGASRGIVVNLQGLNKNIWVRRMTLAHELGHLLWDPDHRLRKLIVDQYADLFHYADVDRKLRSDRDYVEMRANSFAIEFLAPRNAVREAYEKAGEDRPGIEAAMSTFGISKTATVYHLGNAYNGSRDFKEFRGTRRSDLRIDIEPSVDWVADEELAVGFFKPTDVPLSRRGRFAAYVAKHIEQGLCSKDTAAALLQCQPRDIDVALKSIEELVVPLLRRNSAASKRPR